MMKPFDLEKALAGAPVVTRDGLKVHEISLSKRLDDGEKSCPVIGVVEGEKSVRTWTKEGSYTIQKIESDNDLFMAPEVAYVALFNKNDNPHVASHLYQTEQDVVIAWGNDSDFVRAVEVHL